MRKRPYRERIAWQREWRRTGKIPDFSSRPFQIQQGTERKHPRGFLNKTLDGTDGADYVRGRRGDYRKRKLVGSPQLRQEALVLDFERMGTIAITTAFCFSCWQRVRLVDGERGPYSECAECSEPTGVEHLIDRRYVEQIEEEQRA